MLDDPPTRAPILRQEGPMVNSSWSLWFKDVADKSVRVDQISSQGTTNPPTRAEIVAAFGTPEEAGEGFDGIIDSLGLGNVVYRCTVVNNEWFMSELTKAV